MIELLHIKMIYFLQPFVNYMKTFDHIAIIYNPQSTGDAPKLAKDLRDSIDGYREVIGVEAKLYPTKHAGHARNISKNASLNYKRPLIVSVSGDGGYNEVLNGALDAKGESSSASPVLTVAPAGNANDHHRVMHSNTPLIRLIKQAEIKSFDVISITAQSDDFNLKRYAHSYIGFGVTPEIGHELNRKGKNIINEWRIIIHKLTKFEPFIIKRNGVDVALDNLVFANINEMAKVVKLDTKNTVHDDKFEVIMLKHYGRFNTLRSLIVAAVQGFRHVPRYSVFNFYLYDSQLVQLDGEIEKLPKNCTVTITSHHDYVDSLY